MKNVLILNQSHTTNLGDIAIGESLKGWVEGNGWNPIILPFWDENSVFGKLGYSKISSLLKTVPITANIVVGRWIKKLINNVQKNQHIDCAIIGGGELFCSHRGFNVAFSCWVKELRSKGIPCCVIGVSGDDKLSRVQIKRNKRALSNCFFVGVRDQYSKDTFRNLYGINPELAPDSVFLLGVQKVVSKKRENVICVPVPARSRIEDKLESESDSDYYYRILEESTDSNDRVVLTVTEERDQDYVTGLCTEINKKFDTDYNFAPFESLSAFKGLLETGKIVVSGRMHAMILGMLYGCEPKPIVFKTKLKMFKEEYGRCEDVTSIVDRAKNEYTKYERLLNDVMR